MNDVRIYRPAKTVTQSGRARAHCWVLEFVTDRDQERDPLMGWAGQGDTRRQVRLEFETPDEAVAYAKRRGLTYTVMPARERRPKLRAYSDNFRFGRTQNWTH